VSTVALIDYGSGNLRSVERAVVEAARRAGASHDIRAGADPDFIALADRIVLPGVGAFAACLDALRARDGVIEAMTASVRRGAPFLGVCVGMQLLATRGLEFGDHAGLGWIDGEVRPLDPADPRLKVPQMGWNGVSPTLVDGRGAHSLFEGVEGPTDLYFANSFAFHPADPGAVIATVDHGGVFAAAVARDNVAGVQFHPEKSQAAGLALIGRFLAWAP